MKWDKNIFINNIDYLIDCFCAGNAKAFNTRINKRDAATRWRHTELKPSIDALITICNEFGCTVDWLLTGEESNQRAKCPTCGNWSDEVKEACRELQEIMESGDEEAKNAISTTLNVYWNSIEKKGKRKAKKDLPDVQPEAPLRAGKGKQTAAK